MAARAVGRAVTAPLRVSATFAASAFRKSSLFNAEAAETQRAWSVDLEARASLPGAHTHTRNLNHTRGSR